MDIVYTIVNKLSGSPISDNILQNDRDVKAQDNNEKVLGASTVLLSGFFQAVSALSNQLNFRVGNIQSRNVTLSFAPFEKFNLFVISQGHFVPNNNFVKRLDSAVREARMVKIDADSNELSANTSSFMMFLGVNKWKDIFSEVDFKYNKDTFRGMLAGTRDVFERFIERIKVVRKVKDYSDEFSTFLSNTQVMGLLTNMAEKKLLKPKSRYSQDELYTIAGIDETLIGLIPNGVDDSIKADFLDVAKGTFGKFVSDLDIPDDKVSLFSDFLNYLYNLFNTLFEENKVVVRFYKKDFTNYSDNLTWVFKK